MRAVESEAACDDSENGKENVSQSHGKRVRRMRQRFTPSTPTPPPPVNNDDDDNDNDDDDGDDNNDNNDDDDDNDGDERHEKVTTFVGKQPNIKRIRRVRQHFTPSTPTPAPRDDDDADDDDENDADRDNNDDNNDNDDDEHDDARINDNSHVPPQDDGARKSTRKRTEKTVYTPESTVNAQRVRNMRKKRQLQAMNDKRTIDDIRRKNSQRQANKRANDNDERIQRRRADAAQHLHRYASQTQAEREMANERRRQAYAARLAAVDIADERAAAADDERDDDDDVQALACGRR